MTNYAINSNDKFKEVIIPDRSIGKYNLTEKKGERRGGKGRLRRWKYPHTGAKIEGQKIDSDGVVCIFSSVLYMLYGSVGIRSGYKEELWFVFEECTGKIIQMNDLPYGWEKGTDEGAMPPRLSEFNGN